MIPILLHRNIKWVWLVPFERSVTFELPMLFLIMRMIDAICISKAMLLHPWNYLLFRDCFECLVSCSSHSFVFSMKRSSLELREKRCSNTKIWAYPCNLVSISAILYMILYRICYSLVLGDEFTNRYNQLSKLEVF